MELLGNMGEVEARFGLYRDGVNLDARYVHGFRRMYHGHVNLFGHTRGTS
jgi:hypothetical protein